MNIKLLIYLLSVIYLYDAEADSLEKGLKGNIENIHHATVLKYINKEYTNFKKNYNKTNKKQSINALVAFASSIGPILEKKLTDSEKRTLVDIALKVWNEIFQIYNDSDNQKIKEYISNKWNSTLLKKNQPINITLQILALGESKYNIKPFMNKTFWKLFFITDNRKIIGAYAFVYYRKGTDNDKIQINNKLEIISKRLKEKKGKFLDIQNIDSLSVALSNKHFNQMEKHSDDDPGPSAVVPDSEMIFIGYDKPMGIKEKSQLINFQKSLKEKLITYPNLIIDDIIKKGDYTNKKQWIIKIELDDGFKNTIYYQSIGNFITRNLKIMDIIKDKNNKFKVKILNKKMGKEKIYTFSLSGSVVPIQGLSEAQKGSF